MVFGRFAVRLVLFFGLVVLGGCATTEYTTHYGIFTAENSAGESRKFRVYWQTIHYEGWSEDIDRPMPVVLETQCSNRRLKFYDASFGKGRRCTDAQGEGILYCADAQEDVDRRGLPLEDYVLCGSVSDGRGSTDILSLDGEIMITLGCRPKHLEKRVGTKMKNFDYLKPSALPYVVKTKKVIGDDIDLFIPSVSNHSSICDPDA